MILPPWLTVTESTIMCNFCKESAPLCLIDDSLKIFAEEHAMCALLATMSEDDIVHIPSPPLPRKEIGTNG